MVSTFGLVNGLIETGIIDTLAGYLVAVSGSQRINIDNIRPNGFTSISLPIVLGYLSFVWELFCFCVHDAFNYFSIFNYLFIVGI